MENSKMFAIPYAGDCDECGKNMYSIESKHMKNGKMYCLECSYKKGFCTEEFYIKDILWSGNYQYHNKLKLIPIKEKTDYVVIAYYTDGKYKVIDSSKLVKPRQTIEYKVWRDKVFKRDKWTCQHCGKKGKMNAHHIKSFKEYENQRYVVANGITLCESCHRKEHKRLRSENNARVD